MRDARAARPHQDEDVGPLRSAHGCVWDRTSRLWLAIKSDWNINPLYPWEEGADAGSEAATNAVAADEPTRH